MTYIKPIVVALALISMTACSGSKKEQPKLDYQKSNHTRFGQTGSTT